LHRKFLAIIPTIVMLFAAILYASATSAVDIQMQIDKQTYNVNETVYINGNVTENGTVVTDALVAIEILDPVNDPFVLRTVKTGANVSDYWKVHIPDVSTCDEMGNAKTLFGIGETAYLSITIENNDTLDHFVKAAFCLQYSDNSVLNAYYPFQTNVETGREIQINSSFPIPTNAIPGEVLIFASLFSDAPSTGGTAYCPERISSFYISSTVPHALPQPSYFNLTFKIPKNDAKLGDYTVCARSEYHLALATEIKQFKVVLLGDLVKDGKIDMRDIGLLCTLYGTQVGDPRWNPDADIYPDGRINMRDVGMECNNYGATAIS
jgi:hypothetical protein